MKEDSGFVYAGATNAIYAYAPNDRQLLAIPSSPFAVENVPVCGCATQVFGSLQVAQGYLFDGVNADHAGPSFQARKIGADGSVANTLIVESGGTQPATAGIVAPNGRFVYTIDSSSVQLLDFDPASGSSNYMGRVTDDLWNGGVIDPTNTYLFASDEKEIHTYRIDAKTGMLTLSRTTSVANSFPQAIDPDHKYLLTFETPPTADLMAPYGIGVWTINWSSGEVSKVGTYSLGRYSTSYA